MTGVYVHPTAIVDIARVGAGTRIWAFAHVLAGATIGSNCNIGDHGFVEGGAVIGNNVTLKNHVCVWEGITIEDDACVGPHVAFTNDRYPRSPRMPIVRSRYEGKREWLVPTTVEKCCTIGASATIVAAVPDRRRRGRSPGVRSASAAPSAPSVFGAGPPNVGAMKR